MSDDLRVDSKIIHNEQSVGDDSNAASIAVFIIQHLSRWIQSLLHRLFNATTASSSLKTVLLGPCLAGRYAVLTFGHRRSTCPQSELKHWITISLTTASAWHCNIPHPHNGVRSQQNTGAVYNDPRKL